MTLPDLLGKSILSAELQSFMAEYRLPVNPESYHGFPGNVYNVHSGNKEKGIYFTFDGYNRYKPEYGEPVQRYDISKDELFLVEITIENKFPDSKKPSPVELPFGLQFGDAEATVYQKLGKKPYEKSEASYGYCQWTRFDDFRVLAAIGPDRTLIWVRFMKLTLDEKEKIRLKKFLSGQNSNIDPESAGSIIRLAEKMPVQQWRHRMADGDDAFTEKGIEAVEKLLNDYLQSLAELARQKKASGIYNSVKKVVNSLNKTNEKHSHFIETLEREELCEFINQAVRMTGLKVDEAIDLTEEWREW